MSKLKIALLGCGGIQGSHAQVLMQREDAEIAALCDVTTDQCEQFARRMNMADQGVNPPHFDDAAKMYEEIQPDAVSICTPHTLHFAHGMQALEAGCHVLMEKPMVTDAAQAYELAEKVKHSGKLLLIGYHAPYSPEFAYLRELIQQQELGRLELVVGHLASGWMKKNVGKWRQDPALSGGGQAYDSGAHLLNSLCYLAGGHVDEVFAFIDNHGTAVDINSSINVRFENGVFASIVIGGNCPAGGRAMSLIFEGGKVDVDPAVGGWVNIWKGRQPVKYPPITGEPTTPAANLLDAIRGRAEARTGTRDGIILSELMDAIYESARTGRPARVAQKNAAAAAATRAP